MHLAPVLKTSHWYIFLPLYLSISSVMWHKCQSVSIQLHLSKACWEIWLSDDQPHSDYNGQWQRVLCMLAVLQSSQPNPQRNKKGILYPWKQIKICAEYRDMLPRPRLDLSGKPRLRPSGLSPGSWQTRLGLGSMSRYSAQILICISKAPGWNIGINNDDVMTWECFVHYWSSFRENLLKTDGFSSRSTSNKELWCV